MCVSVNDVICILTEIGTLVNKLSILHMEPTHVYLSVLLQLLNLYHVLKRQQVSA